jgi:hypothetical protein
MNRLLPLCLFLALLAPASPALSQARDQIRIQFEWIETNLDDLHALLSGEDTALDGRVMRKTLDQWIAEDRAAVVRSAMVNARSGQRAKVEAVEAVIFASQFTVPLASADGSLRARPVPDSSETRNVGVTVELDPVLDEERRFVEVTMVAEIISLTGYRTFGKDIAEVELPEFHSMSTTTRLSLRNHEPRLVGTFQPPASMRTRGKEGAQPRLLLFVTADFASADEPAKEVAEKESGDFAIHYEFFETDLARLNEWIVDEGISTAGGALHSRLGLATAEKEATLLDTVVAAGSPGRSRFESALEVLYPTHYDKPEKDRKVPAMPSAFESWPTGLSLDFGAEWLSNGLLRINPHEEKKRERVVADYALRLSREIGEQRWLKGESEVTFPLFHEMEIRQRIDLPPGEPVLLGTLRPDKSETTGRTLPVIVVFARAERFGN